jgi:hypothetical protein
MHALHDVQWDIVELHQTRDRPRLFSAIKLEWAIPSTCSASVAQMSEATLGDCSPVLSNKKGSNAEPFLFSCFVFYFLTGGRPFTLAPALIPRSSNHFAFISSA